LPQLSLPIADVGGIPIGLSLLARHGQDDFLLEVAKTIENNSAAEQVLAASANTF